MGDRALRATLPEGVDLAAVLDALRALDGVIDAAVTETAAVVRFESNAPTGVREAIEGATRTLRPRRLHPIGVRYDGADLTDVAARLGCSIERVIERHTAVTYEVVHLGFLPGFAYLGPLDPSLALPRRASPRAKVPAGSVAIAGARTGVYPCASPGGWHLLGSALDFTPFDRREGAVWQVGDRVRFEAR